MNDNMNIVMAMNMGGDEFIIILAHRQIMMLQKILNDIRTLFSNTQDAKMRGYGPGRFTLQCQGRTLRSLLR